MSNRAKKIFLLLSVVVPFMLYCVYYYGMMVKNAPYKFAEFESLKLEYGFNDSLLNKYNSATGDYQFVNRKDSVVKMHMNLSKDDLLYLHRKAAELGFWDFPANEIKKDPKERSMRYIIEYKYKRKTKRVVYDEAYDGNEKLKDANERLIKEIQKKLDENEARLRNIK
ncbi:hypothetical protein FPZ42_05910 [Mucilaginibacter achroorhodeus]|uniref:Uncharacterized protein n=2 Tax=Sphingobacteriaceae TaxID=84566 RepID=A0A563U5H3_9SPHI|nr:hypothetical protein INP83_16065 [Mucilaginibacter sp. 21P]TWR26579.1 hypothetical protein FPZ42_05910 [Mucilaginibacter achroorhodeus]